MSLLAKIRNRSGLLVTIIAVALGVFILESALESRQSFFADDRTTMGTIEGNDVKYDEFEKRYEIAETNEKNRGTQLNESYRDNIRQQVWNQFLLDFIMKPRYEKIGLGVSPEELFDMVQGKDPHPSVKQAFTDPKTNQFDPKQVVNYLNNMDKDETGDMRNRWLQFEVGIKDERVAGKYTTLIKKAMYITAAEAKRDYAFKNDQFGFRYVVQKFADVPDSTIQVSEDEILRAYNENKIKYKQPSTVRGIEYIEFDVNPSPEDRSAALASVEKLKMEFQTAESDSDFVNANSDVPHQAKYMSRVELGPVLDTLYSAPIGTVIGPIAEGNDIKISKLSFIKDVSDSVKARHILIKPVNGDTKKALAKADSLKKLIRSGQSFEALATINSEDPGSGSKGGDLGWFREGMMVKPFNDACFNGTIGDLQIVESQFGVHLIEVTAKGPAVRKVSLSTLVRKVNPSSRTLQQAFSTASTFAGKNNTRELFDAAVKKDKLQKRSAMYVRDIDRTVNGIENTRDLVRWTYEAEKGDVSKVFELENKYVIAVLVSIKEKGQLPLDEVREQAIAEAKKKKKAETMIKLFEPALKSATMLDQVADRSKTKVEVVMGGNFSNPVLQGIGREPLLMALISVSKEHKLSAPIVGENGVFVFELDTKTIASTPPSLKDVAAQLYPSVSGRADYGVFEALKEKADITDNRSRFF